MYISATRNGRQTFVSGHSEYDARTLEAEYQRDLSAGLPIQVPLNYYPQDDATQAPLVRWRAHAHLFFANWINYYVYQNTPYDLAQLDQPAQPNVGGS